MFNVAKLAPKEGLYIECGNLPLKFIAKMRRVMFYWHILTRNENELLYKFVAAQKLTPSEHDWVVQIEKDKKELNLKMSDSEIKKMSKRQFKKIVKTKIEKLAAEYLKKIRESHSKTENLKLKSFSPQDYLLSKNLNISEIQNLYKLRNNMIDVKESFKSSQRDNMWCKTCFLFKETKQHLVDCPQIRDKLNGIVKFEQLQYNMIIGTLKNQEIFARNYTLILNAREDIIADKQPD